MPFPRDMSLLTTVKDGIGTSGHPARMNNRGIIASALDESLGIAGVAVAYAASGRG